MTRLQTYGRTVRAAELASRLWPALAIRGGPEWEEHAAFGDRYSLLEAGLADHARAFLETRVCLFAPTSAIHWVFECMAVGAPPAVLRDPRLGLRELLDEEFDAGVHYLSVRGMEDRPTVERYVRDARARARMGHEASRLVRARHTWRHRAATILHDLSEHLDGPRE